MPCAYDEVRAVAKEAGIAIVLDAAQSFGSTVDGRTLPTVGEYICYSFGPTKILSSVEGGAVVNAGRPAPQSMRRARWYGIDRAARDPVNFWQYDITTPGYRYTSNDVFAAVGLQMLRCFDARLEAHRRVADTYLSCLRDVDGIVLPRVAPSVEPNWWMFTVTVERRFDFMRKLQAKNIHVARPHNRNDRLTCFDGTTANELSGLLYFAEHYVCLPIGPWVSQESAERVCDVIRSGW
jgi:dTDP-4-amino-4,6-dideoxygalactose transaminase